MDVCYSSQEAKPNVPTTHGNQNDSVWSNIGNSNSVWMAMSIKVNGVWGDWSIVKIKGERGTDGTSIKIVGVYNDSVTPNLSIDNLLNVSNVDDSEIVWTKTPHTK
jgi:carbohydrate binding domain-containing protein